MSKDTYNIAIIGLGFGAEFIPIHQAHPNANLVAVCRRNETEMNQVADQFNIPKRYTDYDELLKDPEIDAVHINSPIPDHAPQSLKALRAGKHVMCTVPMATTIEECEEICQVVEETGLKYMMAETVVYSREFLFIKELYEKGELGEIQHLAAVRVSDRLVADHAAPALGIRIGGRLSQQSAAWTRFECTGGAKGLTARHSGQSHVAGRDQWCGCGGGTRVSCGRL